MELLLETLKPITDRRTERRYRPAFATHCRVLEADGEETNGLVWDLSVGGVGLLLPFAPDAGTTLHGELGTEDDRATLRVVFRVAHVRQLDTGDFFIGGKFLQPIVEDLLTPFLTPGWVRPIRPSTVNTPNSVWRKDGPRQ